MKIFAVLASFICAVYCSGGLHEQDASTFPRYLDMALNELGLTQEAGSGIKVVGVRTQVWWIQIFCDITNMDLCVWNNNKIVFY